MAKTWREIFKPEIDEWIGDAVNTAVNNNTRTIYFESVQDGVWLRINFRECMAKTGGVPGYIEDFCHALSEK